MQKMQVFLHPEQKRKLEQLAAAKGLSQSDLVRRGVDMVLAEQAEAKDWKDVTRAVFGIWRDHESLEESVRGVREGLALRHEKLLP